jgi:hypothetical protein
LGENLLPRGFEALEPFVEDWVLEDVAARLTKRLGSTIAEIRGFYDAILPLGEQALAYLRNYQLGALPPDGERLLKLMLALAEVGPAVEWYDNPRVYDGFDIDRIRFVRKIPDNVAQW